MQLGDSPTLRWIRLVTVTAGIVAAYYGIRYSDQPLLEHESWRQTQTAITSYWMIHEGWRLDYQTPVLGYPWSIPLEFPIYQTIAAALSAVGGWPLDRVGRLVSLAFLFGCTWPAFRLSRSLQIPREVPWLFCALLWSSPIYIFYGRNFLIETAALFFTFTAVSYGVTLVDERPLWRDAVMFSLFATLGMLQKVTTAFPMMLVVGMFVVAIHVARRGMTMPTAPTLVRLLFAFAVPVAVSASWIAYADTVNAQNPVMWRMHNSGNTIWVWLAGHGLRFNPIVLRDLFWDRLFTQNAAGFVGLGLVVAGLFRGSAKERTLIAGSLCLFVLPILMFIGHHHFLDYYNPAAVLFLSAAVAISMTSAFRGAHAATMATVAVIAIVFSNWYQFETMYGPKIRATITPATEATLAVSDIVRRYTPAESAVIVYGLFSRASVSPESAWTSEIAYYSERKSLTVAEGMADDVWNDPAAFVGGRPVGAMVFCGEGHRDHYRALLARYSGVSTPTVFPVSGCDVWLPGVATITLPDGTVVMPRTTLS